MPVAPVKSASLHHHHHHHHPAPTTTSAALQIQHLVGSTVTDLQQPLLQQLPTTSGSKHKSKSKHHTHDPYHYHHTSQLTIPENLIVIDKDQQEIIDRKSSKKSSSKSKKTHTDKKEKDKDKDKDKENDKAGSSKVMQLHDQLATDQLTIHHTDQEVAKPEKEIKKDKKDQEDDQDLTSKL